MRDESNRHAWACSWSIGGGHRFEISNPKGSMSLNFTASKNGMTTTTDTVDNPGRFMDAPPQNYNEFYRVATRYQSEVERMTAYAREHTVIHKIEGGTRRPDVDTPRQRFLGIF